MYFLLHPISSLNHLIARLVTDQTTFLISIILFIFISLFYKKNLFQNIDNYVYNFVQNSNGFLKIHAEDFAILGNAIFHILFMLILSIIFFFTKHKLLAIFSILFVLVLSWGFNRLLKIIYKRERPYSTQNSELRIKRKSYCFPSGHVMASIPIYFFSAILLQNLISFLPWYIIAFVVSFLVISSRIYLNHHYFTDILGGIAIGIFCLNISMWFYFFIGLV